MAKLNLWLTRTVRFTGWPIFVAVAVFLVTGYAMADEYGFGRLMSTATANTIHRALHAPLLVLFLVHSLPAMYLALRRWGWIGR